MKPEVLAVAQRNIILKLTCHLPPLKFARQITSTFHVVLIFELVKHRLIRIQNESITLWIGQIKSEIAFSISERGLMQKMIGFKKQKREK